jgi:MFS family permease
VESAPIESLGGTAEGSRLVRRLTSAVVVSALGTWSYNVGIAVYAYQQTHSTTWVAVATVGRYVPALLLTWFGSHWVERFPRRTVAVVADLICAVTMLVLTLVAAVHGSLVAAIALAALSSGVARIQSSAALAVAADLIAESRLVRSMAVINSAEAVATAAGPAIAAAVLAVSTPAVLFLLNGVTFAASAALLSGIPVVRHRRPLAVPGVPAAALDRRVTRAVWPLLATRTIAAAVYGMDVVVLAVLAAQQLPQEAAGYGWLLTAAGVGGLLAAVVLRGRQSRGGLVVLVAAGMALYALPLLCFLLQPDLAGSLATQVVRGLGCVLVTTTVIASLQRAVPSEVSGPVFGLTHTLVLAGTCAGALLAPLLLEVVGLDSTLIIAAVLPFALQLAVLPGLSRFDRSVASLVAAVDPRVATLRGLALFRDASRSTLIEMADGVEEVRLGSAVTIISEGSESDALFVLVDGLVDVSMLGPGGPVPLRRMVAPAYFGEIGLVHGVARTATVVTAGSCTLWRIPAETFLSAAAQAGLSGALSEGVRLRLRTVPAGMVASWEP